MQCVACASPLGPNSKFCAACGTKVNSPAPAAQVNPTLTCLSCGSHLNPIARFCPSCGNAVHNSTTTIAPSVLNKPVNFSCPNCGHYSATSKRFCSKCGEPLTVLNNNSIKVPPIIPAVTVSNTSSQSSLIQSVPVSINVASSKPSIVPGECFGDVQDPHRYCVEKLLGSGSFGDVYCVSDSHLVGRKLALKRLKIDSNNDAASQAENAARFQKERDFLSSLNHPAIVQVLDYFVDVTTQCQVMVMEYVDGGNLTAQLEKAQKAGKQLPVDQVLGWASELCDVLSYLHNRPNKIIFRDMKPDNVMLNSVGQIKLIDFGIARTFKQTPAPKQLGDTEKLGTEGYAPPEAYGNAGQSGPESDVYALAATLHHLLSGEPPQAGKMFIFSPLMQLRSDIPQTVSQAIAHALLIDRGKRTPDAITFKQDLGLTPSPAFTSSVAQMPFPVILPSPAQTFVSQSPASGYYIPLPVKLQTRIGRVIDFQTVVCGDDLPVYPIVVSPDDEIMSCPDWIKTEQTPARLNAQLLTAAKVLQPLHRPVPKDTSVIARLVGNWVNFHTHAFLRQETHLDDKIVVVNRNTRVQTEFPVKAILQPSAASNLWGWIITTTLLALEGLSLMAALLFSAIRLSS